MKSEIKLPSSQNSKPSAPVEGACLFLSSLFRILFGTDSIAHFEAPKPMEIVEEKNSTSVEEPDKKLQPDKKRCFKCDKRVGLFGFPCYCGYIFCAKHRNAEDHNCTFDFKSHGRKQLEKANPLVAPDKMGERI